MPQANKISRLSPQVASQIAAGEVVERPASIVKELVENSLDAGATMVTIEVEQGGESLIRVRDDGCGIPKDELFLALTQHATSKLANLSDFDHLQTLGFRGEALASICAVSQLRLTSKPENQDCAWEATTRGPAMQVDVKPASHRAGTTIEVQDLFYNTPVRRRFLRSTKTEFEHIDALVKRLALSQPDVAFSLKHNGKMIRHFHAVSGDLRRRVQQVYGHKFMEAALELNAQAVGIKLHGWVNPHHKVANRHSLQTFFVNGRAVKDKVITHAIRQACETSGMQPDDYLSYVLYLNIQPNTIDVNVHPTKHEIRFRESRLIHDFIVKRLTDVLADTQFEPPAVESEPVNYQESFVGTPYTSPARSREITVDYLQLAAKPIEKHFSAHEKKEDYKVEKKAPQKLLSFIGGRYLLIEAQSSVYFIDIFKAYSSILEQALITENGDDFNSPQQLLWPVKLVEADLFTKLYEFDASIRKMGWHFHQNQLGEVTITAAPNVFKPFNLANLAKTIGQYCQSLVQSDDFCQQQLTRKLIDSCITELNLMGDEWQIYCEALVPQLTLDELNTNFCQRIEPQHLFERPLTVI